MTAEKQKHPQRCETCKNTDCECFTGRDSEGNYIFGIVSIQKFTEKFGCASHNNAGEPAPKLSSTDLLLLAHDEWKRREERKHLHNEQDWISGFVGGFLTDPAWARKQVDTIRANAEKRGGAP